MGFETPTDTIPTIDLAYTKQTSKTHKTRLSQAQIHIWIIDTGSKNTYQTRKIDMRIAHAFPPPSPPISRKSHKTAIEPNSDRAFILWPPCVFFPCQVRQCVNPFRPGRVTFVTSFIFYEMIVFNSRIGGSCWNFELNWPLHCRWGCVHCCSCCVHYLYVDNGRWPECGRNRGDLQRPHSTPGSAQDRRLCEMGYFNHCIYNICFD